MACLWPFSSFFGQIGGPILQAAGSNEFRPIMPTSFSLAQWKFGDVG